MNAKSAVTTMPGMRSGAIDRPQDRAAGSRRRPSRPPRGRGGCPGRSSGASRARTGASRRRRRGRAPRASSTRWKSRSSEEERDDDQDQREHLAEQDPAEPEPSRSARAAARGRRRPGARRSVVRIAVSGRDLQAVPGRMEQAVLARPRRGSSSSVGVDGISAGGARTSSRGPLNEIESIQSSGNARKSM